MQKSKVVLLLKTFTNEDIKRFSEFLNSPFFNKNKTLVRFYSGIIRHHPDFPENKISKINIYKKTFSGKEYNEQVVKNLTSELLKQIKIFFELESLRSDRYERKMNLLKQLVSRKADPVYLSEVKLFETDLNDLSSLSEKSFHYLFQLEELKISYHLERNEQQKVFDKVMRSGEHLIMYFHLHFIKTISNLNINSQTFKLEYEKNLPLEYFNNTNYESIIKYMKDKDIPNSDLFEMYYLRVLCNTLPFDENKYFKFKDLLLKNYKSLDNIEVYGLFIALETYSLRKLISGDLNYYKELFEIYKTEIDIGVYKFSDTSPLTFMKFRNTVLPALRLKEFDWIEKFIKKYKDDIIEPDRNNVINIARAYINFGKGEFENSLKLISDLNPPQLFLKMDIRNLTLMSYYELGYYDSVISNIDSFKHFLSGNKSLYESFRESNLRFANSLNSLIIFKERDQKDNLVKLKESILPFKGERRIEWLIEKIDLEI